jgi:hypothetical protein
MEEFGVPRVERSPFGRMAAIAAASAMALSSVGVNVALSVVVVHDLGKRDHIHKIESTLQHEHKPIPSQLDSEARVLAFGGAGAITGDVLIGFISVGCVYQAVRVADGYKWGSGAWD